MKLEKVQTEKKQIAERMQRLQELEKECLEIDHLEIKKQQMVVDNRSAFEKRNQANANYEEAIRNRNDQICGELAANLQEEHRVRSVEVRHIRKRHIVTELL